MNRRKFLKRVGLIGAATTVSPSLWLKIISYFKPEKKYVMGGIVEFFPREHPPLSILKVISEKFGHTKDYDWKFRYPEFDEIPFI